MAFYLASWGMYRGSSGLLQKNHLIHEGAVEILYKIEYTGLKCNSDNEVSKKDVPLIMQLRQELSDYYKKIEFERGNKARTVSDTDTLISKILLGTTACVPAYDRYFVVGLKNTGMNYFKFTESSLNELLDFAAAYKNEINNCQNALNDSLLYYPVMKILDMYFWQIGYDREMSAKQIAKNL